MSTTEYELIVCLAEKVKKAMIKAASDVLDKAEADYGQKTAALIFAIDDLDRRSNLYLDKIGHSKNTEKV